MGWSALPVFDWHQNPKLPSTKWILTRWATAGEMRTARRAEIRSCVTAGLGVRRFSKFDLVTLYGLFWWIKVVKEDLKYGAVINKVRIDQRDSLGAILQPRNQKVRERITSGASKSSRGVIWVEFLGNWYYGILRRWWVVLTDGE